jgi:O-antigen/teichoic acid export membrane protein
MLGVLYKSAALRAGAVLGLGGLAFTLANLILARTLRPQEYGVVSLVIGIVAVGGLAAPLGLDLVIGRRGLPPGRQLRRTIMSASTAVGLAIAVASALIYRLEPTLAICAGIMTVAWGLLQASASWYQGQQRFGPATWIVQLSNLALLITALLTALLGFATAVESCVLLAATTAVGGVFAWVLARRATAPAAPPPPGLMGEAFSLVTIHVANSVFLQLERLLLQPLAGVQALALFGVVAALVASPFRMLQMAVLFTLVPNLRRAENIRDRQRLLGREMLLVTSVIGAGSIVTWYVAPPLAHWLLSGRYELSPALMCAALVSGILKLCSAFATGTVIALAEDKHLRRLSLVSWASIGLGSVAALAATPWGLIGVLYGISAGWLVRSVVAAWMAIGCMGGAHLRSPGARLPAARCEDQSRMRHAQR